MTPYMIVIARPQKISVIDLGPQAGHAVPAVVVKIDIDAVDPQMGPANILMYFTRFFTVV